MALSEDLQAGAPRSLQRGFTDIGFQRGLELMARMGFEYRKASFDIFYDRRGQLLYRAEYLRRYRVFHDCALHLQR